jgi:hypothetical protein
MPSLVSPDSGKKRYLSSISKSWDLRRQSRQMLLKIALIHILYFLLRRTGIRRMTGWENMRLRAFLSQRCDNSFLTLINPPTNHQLHVIPSMLFLFTSVPPLGTLAILREIRSQLNNFDKVICYIHFFPLACPRTSRNVSSRPTF